MSLQRWSGSNWLLHCARCHVEANRGQRGCQHLQLPETHQVRAHNMFSRILKLQIFEFSISYCSTKNLLFGKKNNSYIGIFKSILILEWNSIQHGSKQAANLMGKKNQTSYIQDSWKMWWNRYRAQRAHLVQTEEQYIFIHDALVEVIEAGETHINKTALPRYIHSLQCIDVTDEKNHPPKVLEKQHKVCF